LQQFLPGLELFVKRGEKDNNSALQQFADALESASISTIEDGVMDNNLLSRATMQNKHGVETEAFIDEIKSRIQYNS
jgi:isocitrate dehydrogenase